MELTVFFGQGQATDGVFTIQQSSTAPAGFSNSLVITVTTADASLGATQIYQLVQPIEAYNTNDLAWGTASAATVTLSFWVRSSVTGTFGGSLFNSTAARSYPFSYSISSANTFEQKTITIVGDTSGTWAGTNGVGVYVVFGLGVGSTYSGTAGSWAATQYNSATGATNLMATSGATFYITGVQLEKGSTATSFDYRPYGTELALAQRYYQGLVLSNTDITTASSNGTTARGAYISFPIMRAAPTVGLPAAGSGSGQVAFLNSGFSYPTTIGTHSAISATTYIAVSGNGYTGLGTACAMFYSTGASTITLNSEL